MRFHGRRAVVTGGASGIGRATGLRLAAEGARVFVGDVDADGGEALAAGSDGANVFPHTDVTKEADIVALLGLWPSRRFAARPIARWRATRSARPRTG